MHSASLQGVRYALCAKHSQELPDGIDHAVNLEGLHMIKVHLSGRPSHSHNRMGAMRATQPIDFTSSYSVIVNIVTSEQPT